MDEDEEVDAAAAAPLAPGTSAYVNLELNSVRVRATSREARVGGGIHILAVLTVHAHIRECRNRAVRISGLHQAAQLS